MCTYDATAPLFSADNEETGEVSVLSTQLGHHKGSKEREARKEGSDQRRDYHANLANAVGVVSFFCLALILTEFAKAEHE